MKNPLTQEAEFCDDCPMRGGVTAPTQNIFVATFNGNLSSSSGSKRSLELGTYAVFIDTNRNVSEPIRIPDIADLEHEEEALRTVLDHIDQDVALCTGPSSRPEVALGSRTYRIGCYALKGLSLSENIPVEVLAIINPQEITEEIKTQARLDTYTLPKPHFNQELFGLTEE